MEDKWRLGKNLQRDRSMLNREKLRDKRQNQLLSVDNTEIWRIVVYMWAMR